MKTESSLLKIIVVVFALTGLIATIGILGMWMMHGSMMGAGETGMKMMSFCRNMMMTH
jgi:hypothetical protein